MMYVDRTCFKRDLPEPRLLKTFLHSAWGIGVGRVMELLHSHLRSFSFGRFYKRLYVLFIFCFNPGSQNRLGINRSVEPQNKYKLLGQTFFVQQISRKMGSNNGSEHFIYIRLNK